MITERTDKFNLKRLENNYILNEESKRLMKQYLIIERDYRYALREMSAKLENLNDYCEMTFYHNPIHHMESRLKSPDTILEKMYRRNYSIDLNTLKEYIYDIAGVRVICKYVNDIYHIINLLREQKDLKIKLIKDYIKNPKPTGYRSIHVVFNMEIYIDSTIRVVPVEIQFRTIAMDMWASLEHELRYKSNNKLSEEEEKALSKYADDLYNIDVKMQDLYLSIDSIPNE